jgi:hypothetical protein
MMIVKQLCNYCEEENNWISKSYDQDNTSRESRTVFLDQFKVDCIQIPTEESMYICKHHMQELLKEFDK